MGRHKGLNIKWILVLSCIGLSYADVNMAGKLIVKYNLVQHNPVFVKPPAFGVPPSPATSYYIRLDITNMNTRSLTNAGNWKLVMCHTPFVESNRFDRRTFHFEHTIRNNMKLSYVKGCLHQLSPTKDFLIEPGQTHQVYLFVEGTLLSKFSVYPNMYLTNETKSVVIPNTADPERKFVTEPTSVFQLSKTPLFELYPTLDPQLEPTDGTQLSKKPLYERYPISDPQFPVSPFKIYNNLINDSQVNFPVADTDMIPVPTEQQNGNGEVVIGPQTTIDYDHSDHHLMHIAEGLRAKLNARGVPLNDFAKVTMGTTTMHTAGENTRDAISMKIKSPHVDDGGAYSLNVNKLLNNVKIEAHNPDGIVNAVTSLLNIIKKRKTTDGTYRYDVPETSIKDQPRYKMRGLVLDAATDFIQKKDLMDLLDVMCMHKLNYLMLIVANDVAFRLQIEGHEYYTDVGSKFCHDPQEKECLLPQYGIPPNDQPQFYSAKDWMDIVKHGYKCHIKVVPQINFDAYSKAMEIALKRKNYLDLPPPIRYTEVRKENLMYEGKIDYCSDNPIKILNETMSVVKKYYTRENMVMEGFGTGGEDVDPVTVMSNPRCKQKINNFGPNQMKERNHPYVQIKLDFVKKMADVAISNDVTLITDAKLFTAYPTVCKQGCGAGFYVPFNKQEHFPHLKLVLIQRDAAGFERTVKRDYEQSIVMSGPPGRRIRFPEWKENDLKTKVHLFQDHNYKTVISPDTFFNLGKKEKEGFDNYGDPGAIQLQQLFGYLHPDNRCCSSHYCSGYKVVCKDYPPHEGLFARLGTERIKGRKALFGTLLPRLAAVANTAWTKYPWEDTYQGLPRKTEFDRKSAHDDFLKFKSIMGQRIFPKYEDMGIPFNIYKPGIMVDELGIHAVAEVQGHVVQIKHKGSFVDLTETLGQFRKTQTNQYRIRSHTGRSFGPVVEVNPDNQEPYIQEILDLKNFLNNSGTLQSPIESMTTGDPTGKSQISILPVLPYFKNMQDPEGSPWTKLDDLKYRQHLAYVQSWQAAYLQNAQRNPNQLTGVAANQNRQTGVPLNGNLNRFPQAEQAHSRQTGAPVGGHLNGFPQAEQTRGSPRNVPSTVSNIGSRSIERNNPRSSPSQLSGQNTLGSTNPTGNIGNRNTDAFIRAAQQRLASLSKKSAP